MAVFESPTTAPFGAISVYRVVNFFDGMIDAYRQWSMARETDRALRTLSDSELADIGLNRGMIEDFSGVFGQKR